MADPTAKLDPEEPRRWFQFRLRTLLVAIIVLSIPLSYVGWQYKIVAQRKWVIKNILRHEPGKVLWWFEHYTSVGRISWLRREFGDVSIMSIGLGEDSIDRLLPPIEAAFPEAEIEKVSRDHVHTVIHPGAGT